MGKGAKWSAKEDEALAEAWVEVSDPASGVTISSDEFWDAVYARWSQLRVVSRPVRSEKAVKTRWHVLTHTVQRFEAFLTQVAEQDPAAPRESLFDAANKEFLCDQGVPFDRKRVWTVLTSCARWSSNPRSLRKLKRMRKAAALVGDDESPSTKRQKVSAASDDVATSVDNAVDAATVDEPRLGRIAPAPRSPAAVIGPVSAFAASLQRLNDREQEDADLVDEHVQATIAAMGHQLRTSDAAASSSLATSGGDAYAAALADLAKTQREKNELVADQMLMTMLLADSMDVRNRVALEQLKMKYLQRAFSLDSRMTPPQ